MRKTELLFAQLERDSKRHLDNQRVKSSLLGELACAALAIVAFLLAVWCLAAVKAGLGW